MITACNKFTKIIPSDTISSFNKLGFMADSILWISSVSGSLPNTLPADTYVRIGPVLGTGMPAKPWNGTVMPHADTSGHRGDL